jgi:hypothetical protein
MDSSSWAPTPVFPTGLDRMQVQQVLDGYKQAKGS